MSRLDKALSELCNAIVELDDTRIDLSMRKLKRLREKEGEGFGDPKLQAAYERLKSQGIRKRVF